jgi:hypothetical protein
MRRFRILSRSHFRKGKSKVKKAKVKSLIRGFVTRVLAETVSYFVGLDLGQRRDHSALAAERAMPS